MKRRTGATGWIAIAGLVLVGLTSGCLSMMVSEDAPGAASPVVATAATAVAEVEAATQVAPTLAETVAGQTPAGGQVTAATQAQAAGAAISEVTRELVVSKVGTAVSTATPRVTPERVAGTRGAIYSLPAGSAYDDLVVLYDLDDLQVGIMSFDPEIEVQLQSWRDSGQVLQFWGLFYREAEDYGGGRLVVERFAIEGATFTPTATETPDGEASPTATAGTGTPTAVRSATATASAAPGATATPGRTATPSPTRTATATALPSATPTSTPSPTATSLPTATPTPTPLPTSQLVYLWVGTIQGAEPDSPYDDFFESSSGGGGTARYGITGRYSSVARQIALYRDSGQAVRVWGVLDYGVDDYNGCRITVVRIERAGS